MVGGPGTYDAAEGAVRCVEAGDAGDVAEAEAAGTVSSAVTDDGHVRWRGRPRTR